MDWITWLNSLQDPIRSIVFGAAGDFSGGLAAQAVTALLSAAGYSVKKRFAADPHQRALRLTLGKALIDTITPLADTAELQVHLLDLFGCWLRREEVAGQLSMLISPDPDFKLNLEDLRSEFEALDYDPDWLGTEKSFDAIVADLARNFRNAAAADEELAQPLQMQHLQKMVDNWEIQLCKSRTQTLTQRKIAAKLDQMAPLDISDLERAYLRRELRLCNELLLADVNREQERQPRLQRVYVDLRTTTRQTPLEALLARVRASKSPDMRERKSPHLMLLGDPGSGKTTFVRRLTSILAGTAHTDTMVHWEADEYAWAKAVQEDFGRWLLPVRIVISTWSVKAKTLNGEAEDLIAEAVRVLSASGAAQNTPLHDHLLKRINEGSALLLLDGLDEVADLARRDLLVAAVRDFCATYGKTPLLITCRVRPHQHMVEDNKAVLSKDAVATLDRLDDASIARFIERWHAEMEWAGRYLPERSTLMQNRLHKALTERPELRRMAGEPLLLTIMARINYDHELPDSRVELYEELVKELLWEWERRHEGSADETPLERVLRNAHSSLGRAHLQQALYQLAYAEHRQGSKSNDDAVEIPRDRLKQEIAAIYPGDRRLVEVEKKADALAADVLDLIRRRSGLLIDLEDGKRFKFLHQTLHEYLAARWIATGSLSERTRKFLERVDVEFWREAIFLALGCLASTVNEAYDDALAVLSAAWPRQPQNAQDWRRMFLLGEAYLRLLAPLEKQSLVVNAPLRDDVRALVHGALKQVMQSTAPPAATRLEAGLLLADLGVLPDGLDDFVEPFPNAGFLIARYPVTNHQFKRFVDACGYGDKAGQRLPWWSKQGWDYRKRYDWSEPRYWDDARFNRPTQPVVGVSWYEAEAYCVWLNGPGSPCKQAAGRAQLPSVAQWEAAARSDRSAPANKQQEERDYPWAGKFDPMLANTQESKLQQTTPVDMYLGGKTEAGVFDLAGNVWEWTSDVERRDWYFIKGGSWYDDAENARADLRSAVIYGDVWLNSGGFRVVVVPSLSCAPSGC